MTNISNSCEKDYNISSKNSRSLFAAKPMIHKFNQILDKLGK